MDRGNGPKSSERFSQIFRGSQRFSKSDLLFEVVKKVLKSAEKFSEPSPSPIAPQPSAKRAVG